MKGNKKTTIIAIAAVLIIIPAYFLLGDKFYIVLIAFCVVFIIGTVIYVIINPKMELKKEKLMMQDERLKNAKLFHSYKSVAISPDGFIGVNVPKITIFHIKEIEGFQITFDEEKTENDKGGMVFNNIISKVEPYFLKKNENGNLLLKIANKKAAIKIPLLMSNSNVEDGETIALGIPGQRQKEIREFLGELERVEKNVKEQSQ